MASLEYLGMLPFLLLIALAGIQLGIAAYCGSQAATAARTAARTAAQPAPDGGEEAGRRAGVNAVSGWVNPDITWPQYDQWTVKATATVRVPSVLPGLRLIDPVRRSATMPKEDTTP
ncbi:MULTISPECIES: TadE/TadG family type IV pilus assembly protein [unclassified Streptomyces]|uniref:TadE/TadG family type IV pilus assembly protein n=1 Tax=unclassified Streptomyces TaxID=2593676 RepID=UPI002E2B3FA0|nr:TadE/TadG family type IV pilus assembly protein [Streptomyces sp. NBC_00223]